MANPSTRDSSFGTTESGNPLLQKFDGSGRLPRPTQVKALNWIHDNFDSSPSPLVIEAGVGCGKTALLRAAQLQYGGSIATSQNTLVSQYQSDYPNLNVIIGMQHYRCSQYLTRCGYASQRYNCRGCMPSSRARRVVNVASNPWVMDRSFSRGWRDGNISIHCEAH